MGKSFGVRIREARMEQGLSQKDIAERLQTSVAFISALEREEQLPPLSKFEQLTAILGLQDEQEALWDSVLDLQRRIKTEKLERQMARSLQQGPIARGITSAPRTAPSGQPPREQAPHLQKGDYSYDALLARLATDPEMRDLYRTLCKIADRKGRTDTLRAVLESLLSNEE